MRPVSAGFVFKRQGDGFERSKISAAVMVAPEVSPRPGFIAGKQFILPLDQIGVLHDVSRFALRASIGGADFVAEIGQRGRVRAERRQRKCQLVLFRADGNQQCTQRRILFEIGGVQSAPQKISGL